MYLRKLLIPFITLLLSVGFYSCDPPAIEEINESLGFNKKFASKALPFSEKLAEYSDKFKNGRYEQELSSEKPQQQGDFICTTKRVKVAAEYNENIVLDPTTNVFYVGSILQGNSIETGAYTPVVIQDRSPITISISLENIDGKVSQEVEEPKNSSVRQAIRNILAQKLSGSTAARVSLEQTEVRSANELGIAVGAGYSYNGGLTNLNLAASFDFNKKEQQSRTVIKFVQVYYTIDLDLDKGGPYDWFDNTKNVDINLLDGMPVYISSVKFGRMVLFTIESKASFQEVKAAFNLAVSNPIHNANLNASAAYKKVNENSSIRATVIGGSGLEAAKVLTKGLEGIYGYINTGGNYTKESPAAPLGYTMRSLYNNEVVKSILASEYNIRNCQQNTGRYKIHFNSVRRIKLVKGENDNQREIEVVLGARVKTPLAKTYQGHSSLTPFILIEDTHSKHQYKTIGTKEPYNVYKIDQSTRILSFNKSDIEALVELDFKFYEEDYRNVVHEKVEGAKKIIDLKKLQPTREYTYEIQNPQGYGTLVYRVEVLPPSGAR